MYITLDSVISLLMLLIASMTLAILIVRTNKK